MTKRSFDPDKLAVKDADYHRVYYTIRDKEFIADTAKIKEEILRYFPKNKAFFNFEPDVLLDAGIPKNVVSKIAKLAKKYGLTSNTIRLYLDGYLTQKGSMLLKGIPAAAQAKNGSIVLTMGKEITHQAYRELWPMVEMVKEELVGTASLKKRHRGPANYELIYFIGKAIRRGSTLREVYKMYQDEALPGYQHKETDYPFTYKELAEYYDRYKFPGT